MQQPDRDIVVSIDMIGDRQQALACRGDIDLAV
jgi:hypothetical protein